MRAEIVLDVHHDDARMARHEAGTAHAVAQARHALRRFQRILRRHQPPDLVEAEPLQRHLADMHMAFMRRIERAAEQPDPHARRDRPRRPYPIGMRAFQLGLRMEEMKPHGRICPVPRTIYLNVVICSTPTGPRACSLPVPIPISAPMPNSAPSANCVEAFHSKMAESSTARKCSAAAASWVTMVSV